MILLNRAAERFPAIFIQVLPLHASGFVRFLPTLLHGLIALLWWTDTVIGLRIRRWWWVRGNDLRGAGT